MDADLARECAVHKTRAECPDALIEFLRGGYGLIVHDGGTSVVSVDFCPWWGSKLPEPADLSES
jgi:hypothetical protein